MEERLIVGGTFDPSGIVSGVKGGTAALEEFERRIQQIAASLPGINVEEFLAGARKAAQEEIADLQRLQLEATRTGAALNDAGVSTRRMAEAFNVAGEAGRRASEGTAAWSTGLANLRTQVATTADATARMFAAFNVAGESGRRASEGTAAWSQGLANLRVQITTTADATTRLRDAFNVAGEAGRRASEGTAAWQQGLANLQAQLQQVRAQQDAIVPGAQRMAAGFAAAGAQARAGRAGSDAWAAGLANLQVQSTAAVNGTAGMTRGANLARNSLVMLAAQSLGTSSAIGNLAQSALIFAGGSAAIAAVAGAILIAAKAVEFLTAKSREAKRAHEDLLASLKQRVAAQDNTPPNQRAAMRAEIDRMKVEAERIQRMLALQESSAAGTGNLVLRLELQKNINERVRLGAILLRDETAAEKEYIAARVGPGQNLIADLGRELAVLQTSADAVARLTIVGSNLKEGQRAGALAIHDQTVALRAQIEAAEKTAEALEKVLKAQHDLRVEQSGGGNRTPGAGGTDTGLPIGGGGLLFGATGEEIGASHAAAIARATEAMEKFRQATQAAVDASDFSQMVEQLRSGSREAEKFAKALEKAARSDAERLADSLTDIGTAAFAIADVGASLGLIGDQAARSIADVGRLSDALAAVALEASTGNILGAVVSGASLLGGLIGGGPTQQEMLIKELNQRLTDLKLSLDRTLVGAGALEVAARDLAAIQNVPRTIGPKGIDLGIDEDALRAQLAAAGSTIEEWAARIEAVTGFDVLDDAGHVIEASAAAAAAALELLREDVENFGKSVAEQARLISNHDRIFGGGSDLTRNRSVILGGLELDPEVEKRIRDLDLETEAGRIAYLAFLQQMQLAAEAGTLTAEQLGAFQDVAEFSDKAAEGADALAAAAEDAAQRIEDAAAAEVRARELATQALQDFNNDIITRSQFMGADASQQFKDLSAFLRAGEVDNTRLKELLAKSDTTSAQGIAELQQALQGSGLAQSPALKAILDSANTATAQGREDLKQALFQLLIKAQFNTLTPEELGSLSPDALEDLIRQLGGLVDTIGSDAARAADEAQRSAEQVQRDQEAAARAARQAFEEARRQAVDARREQERLGELRERLAGSDQSAAAKFARDVDRLRDAMPQVGDILEGLDLDDPKSREVLRKRLAALFDQFTGGDFEKLNFTRDEFLAFLEKGADFLDEFGNSVNDATKSMLNFPTGINLAALEFQAQAAGAKDVARILPVSLPSRRGTDGAALPQIIDDRLERAVVALAERTGGDTITYNVTVHLPRGSTAEQARAFVEALKRQSVVRTGTPDKWSQG